MVDLRGKADLAARVKKQDAIIEKLQAELERARKPKIRLPAPAKQAKSQGAHCRVILPDTHGSLLHLPSWSAVAADIKQIDPAHVIMTGDHMDCGGFLAEHHTMGYVAQTEYSFSDDVAAANQMLDQLQQAAPRAQIEMIEGNHESRIEAWIVTKTIGHTKDAVYLRKMFGPETVMNLKQRGIAFFERGKRYDGLAIPGTIRRGKCCFTHGSYTGQHAASQHVKKFGGNVVYGHTHRADSYTIRTVNDGAIGGWNPGCLCELQPMWRHTSITDWSHGYGLQLVETDGRFLHINVPVIDGKSLLHALLKAAA